MAITYPRTDIYPLSVWQDAKFKLLHRQEISTTIAGQIFVKDFGAGLWTAEMVTKPLKLDPGLDLEAMLNSLDGSLQIFTLGDVRKQYPREYPTGNFVDSGKIASLNPSDASVIALQNLPANFVVSRGDYFSFLYGSNNDRALHQAMETVQASAGGLTPSFTVRPHIRPGAVAETDVVFKRPTANFVMQPESLDTEMQDVAHMVISFSAVQFLS